MARPVWRATVRPEVAKRMRIELGAETATVRTFGARGDGTSDDTAALQAATDWIRSDRVLVVEPGEYRVTDTLDITRSGGEYAYTSVAIKGVSTGASGPHGTVLVWDGPPDRTMVRLWARDSLLEGVAFRCATGRTLASAVDVSKSRDGTMVTNVRFNRVQVHGQEAGTAHDGVIEKGVRVGTTPQSATNLEHFIAEQSWFINCTHAGYSIESQHMQAKYHIFRDCHWRWQPTSTPTGTAIDVLTGSVHVFEGSAIRLERFVHVGGAVDSIMIQNPDTEWIKRLFETRTVSAGNYLPVTMHGGRYQLAGLGLETANIAAQDGDFIKHGMPASLHISGCAFRKGYDHLPQFAVRGAWGTQIVSQANLYPNTTPFQGDVHVHSIGDTGILPSGGHSAVGL